MSNNDYLSGTQGESSAPERLPSTDGTTVGRQVTAADNTRARSSALIPPARQVAGCGNSSLSHDLHAEGYRRLLSVDFSPVVVQKMSARYPALDFACCDCTSMEAHPDGAFGAVVDKGLLVSRSDPGGVPVRASRSFFGGRSARERSRGSLSRPLWIKQGQPPALAVRERPPSPWDQIVRHPPV